MDSTFSGVTVKQEAVSDYEGPQTVDTGGGHRQSGEPSGGDYGLDGSTCAFHDGSYGPATSAWTMLATDSSDSNSTMELRDSDSYADAATDSADDVSTSTTRHGYGDDLFQYDEESDSEDDSSVAQPHPQDVHGNKQLPWTTQLSTTKVEPFSVVAGPSSAGCKTSRSPVDFFHLFFPEGLYKEAQTETNNYAEYYQEKRRDLGREWWEWTDPAWEAVESKQDMRVFLGICIAMAVQTLPNPQDYWSKQKNVRNALIARSGMSMGRFERIMHYFYLSNPWRDPEKIANQERRVEACNRDPLYKIGKSLPEHVKRACMVQCQPHQDIVMEELAGTVHRKPGLKTNGWKLLVLKDAYTGYVTNFQWYHDPDTNLECSNSTMTEELAVTSLVENLADKGHCLYADSVFISPKKACQFKNLGTHVVTNCSDWPKNITSPADKLEVGSTVSVQYKGVTATLWQGQRVKRCLSTMHDGLMQPLTLKLRNSTTREHTIKNVPCPTAIVKHTTVIDKLPPRLLLLSQGSILQKLTNSWWKRLVWLLVDICINNAYIVWTASKGQRLSHSEFVMEIAAELASDPRKEQPKQHGPTKASTVPTTSTANTCSPSSDSQRSIVSYSMLPAFQLRHPAGQQSVVAEGSNCHGMPQPNPSSVSQIVDCNADEVEHCLVKFSGRGRNCRQCAADKTRTRSGRRRDTQFGCSACDVNLCRSGCFVRFHEAHGYKVTAASMADVKLQIQPPAPKRLKHSV